MNGPQTFRRKVDIQGLETEIQWRSDLQTLKLAATNSLEMPEITPQMTQCYVPEGGDFKTKTISWFAEEKLALIGN